LATHKSAEKRARQNEKRRIGNVSLRSGVKTSMKTVLTAVEEKDRDGAVVSLQKAVPAIARAASRGAFPKKTASRRISRLTKKVNALKKMPA
jgi:small subunit ribosomal protein S20